MFPATRLGRCGIFCAAGAWGSVTVGVVDKRGQRGRCGSPHSMMCGPLNFDNLE